MGLVDREDLERDPGSSLDSYPNSVPSTDLFLVVRFQHKYYGKYYEHTFLFTPPV